MPFNAVCVAFEKVAILMPGSAEISSMHMVPGPPMWVSTAKRFPVGTGCLENALNVSENSAMLRARISPNCLKAPS